MLKQIPAIVIFVSFMVMARAEEPAHSHHHHPAVPEASPPPEASPSPAPVADHSAHLSHGASAAECGEMEVWDYDMGMCAPLAMAGMPMRMLMVHGNAFGALVSEQGPRGARKFAAPNMFMADLGQTVGDRHYVNLSLMGTFEKWTFPEGGYPELLQVGEHNDADVPYVDAQHPHSSPIMGLTLSDTISLGGGSGKDHLKLSFAPRGQSTEGPIAFMHRPTGMVNPDAPLGHHIGQDVGHISSTVIAASLGLGRTRLQVSAFNGNEPEPTKVDLPLGAPNSFAARLIQEFSPSVLAMASAAYVHEPHHDDASVPFLARYSASLYHRHDLGGGGWKFQNAFIFGLVTKYDHADQLMSFGEEFLFTAGLSSLWGRIEVLQRTPSELAIVGPADADRGRWLAATTLGYTHAIAKLSGVQLALGTSVTKDFLPDEFQAAYGGNPWTGKLFLQLSGMGMWGL